MDAWPYWFEIAVICALTTVGNIVMGHWAGQTPKWQRLLKTGVICAVSVLLSATAGRAWFFVMLGVMAALLLVLHGWWLPRKGVNGWTAEPREKYHALRGWKWPPERR